MTFGIPSPHPFISQMSPKADDEVKAPLTLDELFKKTETKPMLYWLPLTDGQVAARKAKAGEQQA